MRWYVLDPAKVAVRAEVVNPNLRAVDEVGVAMLMPGGGHGFAGSANMSNVELFATRCRGKRPTMRHHLIAAVMTVAGLRGRPARPGAGGGWAEAAAAAVVDPKWTPPKLTWGLPISRASGRATTCAACRCRGRAVGERRYLTDEEFTERAETAARRVISTMRESAPSE